MNSVRANAKKHAREELSTEYENLVNRQTFPYEDFKRIVALLPAKVLEEAAETAGKAAPASEGSGASNHITEDKFPSVAVEKMEAWHNGTRKQNVGACNDEKLKMYYDICKVMGFEEQASILAKELKSRGLQSYVVDSKHLNFNNMRRVNDYADYEGYDLDYERMFDQAYDAYDALLDKGVEGAGWRDVAEEMGIQMNTLNADDYELLKAAIEDALMQWDYDNTELNSLYPMYEGMEQYNLPRDPSNQYAGPLQLSPLSKETVYVNGIRK